MKCDSNCKQMQAIRDRACDIKYNIVYIKITVNRYT